MNKDECLYIINVNDIRAKLITAIHSATKYKISGKYNHIEIVYVYNDFILLTICRGNIVNWNINALSPILSCDNNQLIQHVLRNHFSVLTTYGHDTFKPWSRFLECNSDNLSFTEILL